MDHNVPISRRKAEEEKTVTHADFRTIACSWIFQTKKAEACFKIVNSSESPGSLFQKERKYRIIGKLDTRANFKEPTRVLNSSKLSVFVNVKAMEGTEIQLFRWTLHQKKFLDFIGSMILFYLSFSLRRGEMEVYQ